MRHAYLAAALLAASCKCAPKPGEGAGTGPQAPVSPMQAVPQSDSTLSVLTADGPMCVWARFDPVTQKSATVARVRGPCGPAAWSHDGKKGLLAVHHGYQSENEGPPPDDLVLPWDLYEVSFADGSTRLLGQVPGAGELDTLGFDPQGRAIALTVEVPDLPADAKEITWQGQSYPIPADLPEGDPALAHAFVAEGDTLRHLKTEVTSTGTDADVGAYALAKELDLGPRSWDVSRDVEGRFVPEDDPRVQRLDKACGGMGEAHGWIELNTPTPLFLYESEEGEFATPALCLVTDDGTTATALPEANAADTSVEASVHGPYVMLFSADRHFVRVYDTRTKRIAGTARGDSVTFWPDVVAPAPTAPK